MNVFDLRNRLIQDYALFVSSFVNIRDPKIREYVEAEFASGTLWPQALVQLNVSSEQGESVYESIGEGLTHEGCARVFQQVSDLFARGIE